MKIIITLLFLTNFSFGETLRPVQGLYYCESGNEDSICDQILKTFYSGDKLSAIRVEYVGECGSMGPYTYYCEDNVCEDPGLKFVFEDNRNYYWTNKQYGFECNFKKK
jgi:hypothetical protein